MKKHIKIISNHFSYIRLLFRQRSVVERRGLNFHKTSKTYLKPLSVRLAVSITSGACNLAESVV